MGTVPEKEARVLKIQAGPAGTPPAASAHDIWYKSGISRSAPLVWGRAEGAMVLRSNFDRGEVRGRDGLCSKVRSADKDTPVRVYVQKKRQRHSEARCSRNRHTRQGYRHKHSIRFTFRFLFRFTSRFMVGFAAARSSTAAISC